MESLNYFNYFTEIEEHFWRKRGAHLLVSPLDWAIVETWQKAGVPLQAVLKGIDRAFESWQRSRRAAGGRQMKSLAYCVDAVLDAAAEAQEASAGSGPEVKAPREAEPFSRDELRKYFQRNAARLRAAAEKQRSANVTLSARIEEAARSVEDAGRLLDTAATADGTGASVAAVASPALDLEDLERRLTVIEDKLSAALTAGAGDETLLAVRREMDASLAPYRRKMSSAQLAQLERQYAQKRLFEHFQVPRLSLFYLT